VTATLSTGRTSPSSSRCTPTPRRCRCRERCRRPRSRSSRRWRAEPYRLGRVSSTRPPWRNSSSSRRDLPSGRSTPAGRHFTSARRRRPVPSTRPRSTSSPAPWRASSRVSTTSVQGISRYAASGRVITAPCSRRQPAGVTSSPRRRPPRSSRRSTGETPGSTVHARSAISSGMQGRCWRTSSQPRWRLTSGLGSSWDSRILS
jgi:hypothetical protein